MSVLCMLLLLLKLQSSLWIAGILLFWLYFIHHRVSVCSDSYQIEAKNNFA